MNLGAILAAFGLTPQMLIIMALPALGVLLLFLAAFGGGKDRKKREKLIERASGRFRPTAAGPAQEINVRVTTSESAIPALDRLIKQALPRRDQLKRRLARSGLELTLGSYLIISVIVAVIGAAGLYLTGLVPPIAALLGGLASGVALPNAFVTLLGKRRQARFLNDFPEAIDLMTRGLKSGLPIVESIKVAGEEVPGPVGFELARIADAVRLGGKLDEVLWEASDRLGIQEFKFFTISLSIQAETGGNLTETLANLADVLRRRRQLKLKIKALSSEAKASAYIIGSLPFIMSGVIYMVNANYLMKLIEDPRGHVLIGMGLGSFLVGAVVMFKMVRFDY